MGMKIWLDHFCYYIIGKNREELENILSTINSTNDYYGFSSGTNGDNFLTINWR